MSLSDRCIKFCQSIKIVRFIMNNNPFYSTNTSILNESFCNSRPTNLNGQNVIVSQEQQRKLIDSLNTAIVGFPCSNNCTASNFVPGNFIQARKQFIPGGVQFLFMPQQQVQQPQPQRILSYNPLTQVPNQIQETCFCPTTLEQQIAINSLNKHGLESLEYQQQLSRNPFFPQYQQQNHHFPFQLRFHQNVGTDTNQLNVGSRNTPDFCNLGGFSQMQTGEQAYNSRNMETDLFNSCTCKTSTSSQNVNQTGTQFQSNAPQCEYSSARRLVLSKPPQLYTGHLVDVLDEISEPSKKKVSFSENICKGPVDQSGQSFPCQPCDGTQPPKEDINCPEDGIGTVDKSEQVSFPCECSVGNNSRCETSPPKSKPKRSIWPMRKARSSEGTESCSSGSEAQKKRNKTKQKKSKKKQREDEYTTSESE
ncbi:uncharacterized protein [Leptinotarsa decemlineata]|uniref:uncharacterized protein n=1 Tax=Leptinotarsa decemlineata TaxID=7539 RepID=UPI003D308BB8